VTIPTTADDLTAAWCSEALDRPVTTVTATPLGVGVGLVGQLYRLDLDGPDGRSTLVAKLAAPTPETRFVATVLNMYEREVRFYTDLSARTPIGHPRCHYAAHDPDTQDTVLLLEDVSPRGRALDQVEGCTLDEARPAIRTLARLHAAYWDDATLGDTDWLTRIGDEPYPSVVAAAFEAAWPDAQTLFPDVVTPTVRTFGDAYAANIPALFETLGEGPLVLSHADWRLDNLFFTPDGEVVAVDWQLIDRSAAPRDLAYLVTQSVNIDDPAGYAEALTIYLADLAAHGIEPDLDWAWDKYRAGTRLGFAYPVIAAGGLTVADPRHLQLCEALLRRSVRAIEALDLLDPA